MEKKKKKMTLKGYYDAIPLHSSPRRDFVQKLMNICGVSEQTVRNWCLYGIRPQSYKHVVAISQLTGIKEEDLWEE